MKRWGLAALAASSALGLVMACGGSDTGSNGGSGPGGNGSGAGHVGNGGSGLGGSGMGGDVGGGGNGSAHGGGGMGSGASGPAGNVSSSTGTSSGSGGSGPCGIASNGGKTYYVDQGAAGADDKNPGTKASPWKTIQQAGNVAQAGDTIVVEPGTYAGVIFGWDDPNQGPYSQIKGTAAKPIVFQADPAAPAGSVVINSKSFHAQIAFDLEPGCDYVDIVGFKIENDGTVTKAGIKVAESKGNRILDLTVDGVGGIGGIFVDGVTDALIQGNTVLHTKGTGTTGHGMYLSGSTTDTQVLFNHIHDNDYVGIHVNGDISEGGRGTVLRATIGGNLIHDNGQNGINCDGIVSSVFVNNVIYNNERNGIELYQIDAGAGSTKNVIVNNSIDQSNHGYAIEVSEDDGASSTGNIAFDDVLFGASGPTNATGGQLSTSSNLTSGSPFVNQGGHDYTLAPNGPGAGKGVASFGGADAPKDGSANDIGAFGFGLVPLCP